MNFVLLNNLGYTQEAGSRRDREQMQLQSLFNIRVWRNMEMLNSIVCTYLLINKGQSCSLIFGGFGFSHSGSRNGRLAGSLGWKHRLLLLLEHSNKWSYLGTTSVSCNTSPDSPTLPTQVKLKKWIISEVKLDLFFKLNLY